jgi:ribosome-binding factor A
MRSKKAPSQRQLRVGELVRHALADIFMRGEVSDLDGIVITVTEVTVTPDLRSATAYVLPLGGGDTEKLLAALGRARRFIRGQVSRRVDMKYMPDIAFRLDDTFDRSAAIDRLLHDPRVVRDLDGESGD